MTRYELLDLLVGAVGSAAVAVTVLQAAWQARAARAQSAVLSAQVVAEQLLALDRVFIDRPERRPYFYFGRKPSPPVASPPGGDADLTGGQSQMAQPTQQWEAHEHDPVAVIGDRRTDERGEPVAWVWHLECYDCGEPTLDAQVTRFDQ